MVVCGKCQMSMEPATNGAAICPHCGNHVTDVHESTSPSGAADSCAEQDDREEADVIPEQLGRYRLTSLIAEGSFAAVYRGHDEELGRDVAVKVLHRRFTSSEKVMSSFVREARILARLEHPGIVPVYDMGRSDGGLYYLVMKFIDGSDLKSRIKKSRLALVEAVEIVAQVAEALQYAHRHGLVHRDVKPGNILLDDEGHPLLVDFGLALREEDFGTGPMNVGTPLYMSPEQARREGHRVDARSDIYSLGVVFYELITGQHPFRGKSLDELLEFIRAGEAIPPRALDKNIPRELERIWLKADAKRASERYDSARDFAEDLRHWLAEAHPAKEGGDSSFVRRVAARAPIVPRGLRSFEAEDASFFLDLLPGPRNRDGLPESIQFWKTRLESTDPEQAFRVGLLYGPSGSGKSSLVKAGLIPRLGPQCVVVFLEAEADFTEERLFQALRRHCPDLPVEQGLVQSLVSLRDGKGLPPDKKLIIILDQFEQWLHAPHAALDWELIDALRQCDGSRVQALLLVRDDFWLAVSRFMRNLELPLVEGHNTSLMDLFDPFHTRKVLAEYGRALGRLPENLLELSPDENRFLDEAVEALADQDKIIPVRLTLFAEVVKSKPWTPATLKQLGGADGMGIVFFEETFSAPTAPAAHRLHQQAACAVLQALLPTPGTDIKGTVRSREELQRVSGYLHDPGAFDDLLRILDQELRLVTPTAPEQAVLLSKPVKDNETQIIVGVETGTMPTSIAYQLTHDYLVPALRQWLTRKQRGSMRGRAMIRLAERADEWSPRREQRQLPSWWEWLDIVVWTRARDWSDTQRKMMALANRRHGIITVLFLIAVIMAGMVGVRVRNQVVEERNLARADQLVAAIKDFHASQLSRFHDQVNEYRQWTVPKLREMILDPETDEADRLHARLVLLPLDSSQVAPLTKALLTVDPQELLEIRTALLPYKEEASAELWRHFDDRAAAPESRFRTACALAGLDPSNPRWNAIGPEIVEHLFAENTFYLSQWLDALRPVRKALLAPLARIFRDRTQPRRQISMADALANYAADEPEFLADLLLDASHEQYARLWPAVEHQRTGVVAFIERDLAHPKQGDPEDMEKRHAQAVVTLFRLGQPEHLRQLLKQSPNPDLRTFLIDLFARLGCDPHAVIRRYQVETEVSTRRALLQALGEFELDKLPATDRPALMRGLLATYRDDPDPGIHSALAWALRRWGHGDDLRKIDRELISRQPLGKRHWYVNGQMQTLAVVPGPVEFAMGSPASESERLEDETQRRVRIPRSFAIATEEVTLEQFLRFQANYSYHRRLNPEPKAAVCGIDWFDAVRYSRWLSEQEGVPEEQMCYPPLAQIKEGMKLPDGFLSRTGYRLPTEAEWEYACRAGSSSSRFYGNALSMLKDYAWYGDNAQGRNHPVGLLKPNDLGLFDIYGNMWEWCQDPYEPYEVQAEGTILDDKEKTPVGGHDSRVLRGGGYGTDDSHLRSAARRGEKATDRNHYTTGLRLARTIR